VNGGGGEGGRVGSGPEAVKSADAAWIAEWIKTSNREMEVAASTLKIIFWIIEKDTNVEPHELVNFLAPIDALAFTHEVKLPDRLDSAIARIKKSREQMETVGNQLERLVTFSVLLHDIKKVVASFSGQNFQLKLDDVMSTERGFFINTTILRQCGCEYRYIRKQQQQQAMSPPKPARDLLSSFLSPPPAPAPSNDLTQFAHSIIEDEDGQIIDRRGVEPAEEEGRGGQNTIDKQPQITSKLDEIKQRILDRKKAAAAGAGNEKM